MNSSHHRYLEELYVSARINRRHFPGTDISIGDGKAEITWQADDSFFHGMDALHGSVFFKLLDDAAFFAVNSLLSDYFALTTSFDLDLVRPAKAGKLIATGAMIHRSESLWVARSELKDSRGRTMAFGTGRFTKSKIPFEPLP